MPTEGTAAHWTVNAPPASHAECEALWRSIASLHYSKGSSGYTFYNWGYCNHGLRLRGRGWDRQSGANGTSAANSTYWAVVWVGGPGHVPNAAALGTLQGLVDEAPGTKRARPHSDFFSTACPGPDIRAWCARYSPGAPAPGPGPAPPPLIEGEETEMVSWTKDGFAHFVSVAPDGSLVERMGTFEDGFKHRNVLLPAGWCASGAKARLTFEDYGAFGHAIGVLRAEEDISNIVAYRPGTGWQPFGWPN